MTHKLLPNSPELFHGTEKSRPYFEGWYFKHVSEETGFSLAVIPGVSRGADGDDHCFIQILNNGRSHYIKYPIDDFKVKRDKFEVGIKGNFFSLEKMILDINEPSISIKASFEYKNHVPLETNRMSPSIMGPFSYLPRMQCNHGVLSLCHDVGGYVVIDGEEQNISGIAGYIEKDWGEAFPGSWLWLQCNGHSAKYGDYSCM